VEGRVRDDGLLDETRPDDIWLAGVDGCRGGWIAAFLRPAGEEVRLRVVPRFADIVAAPERPAIVAVDMPIGLPERGGRGGRAAENAVRPLLGGRQSSVFSIPSRAAVYAAADGPADPGAAHRRASEVARATSDPPRGVAIQTFSLFPKVREIDALLREEPGLAARVFEVHPEVTFWRMNGEAALAEPKKVKNQPYGPGLQLRRALLEAAGMPEGALAGPPPPGSGEDDRLDALACALTARRLKAGLARSFPDPPERDAFGLAMAIWA
jgi:predicted RNase H-like nuclease